MKRFGFLMVLAALAFPLTACGTAESEGSGDDAGEATAAETTSGDAAAEAICCGGGCDAPAGSCCSDGTCGGNHEELPIAP